MPEFHSIEISEKKLDIEIHSDYFFDFVPSFHLFNSVTTNDGMDCHARIKMSGSPIAITFDRKLTNPIKNETYLQHYIFADADMISVCDKRLWFDVRNNLTILFLPDMKRMAAFAARLLSDAAIVGIRPNNRQII